MTKPSSVLQDKLLLMLVDLETNRRFCHVAPIWGQEVHLLTLENIWQLENIWWVQRIWNSDSKMVRKAYLRGWLCQAHEGLPLWRGCNCAQIQVVGLQLCDRGKKRRARQRGSREMGRWSVHLLVAPEIEGDLFADGGRPGTPLMLNGCEV